jgi:hypothetical protein
VRSAQCRPQLSKQQNYGSKLLLFESTRDEFPLSAAASQLFDFDPCFRSFNLSPQKHAIPMALNRRMLLLVTRCRAMHFVQQRLSQGGLTCITINNNAVQTFAATGMREQLDKRQSGTRLAHGRRCAEALHCRRANVIRKESTALLS